MTEVAGTYRTITQTNESLFRDRGSKFLGYAFPVQSRSEVRDCIDILKEDHPKARHHCFSFRIGGSGQDYRISDDGEPAGSAGQPIYQQLLSFNLTNILVVVVRYFGGTKLGKSGLINAYKTASYEALSQANIVIKHLSAFYEIKTNYDHSAILLSAFKSKGIEVTDVKYLDQVIFDLKLRATDHHNHLNLALMHGLRLQAVEMLSQISEEDLTIRLIDIET